MTNLPKVRQHWPGLPAMVEPDACSKHVATATEPFGLPGGTDRGAGLFGDDPVAMYVEGQRNAGRAWRCCRRGRSRLRTRRR